MTTKKEIQRPDCFLVPVDESESSDKAVRYLAELAENLDSGQASVTLFHTLPMPPRLVEHGGAENPASELARETDLARERAQWVRDAQSAARPIFDHARELLQRADLKDDRVRERTSTELHDDLARQALDAARESGCGTIVIGRSSFPWYRELTHHHVADALLAHGEGFAIVVVQ